ncbi:MAG: M3 family metallopeptidase [Acidimicrobiales bacterium]
MPEGEEQLASIMSLTGSSAWSQLYADVSSSITADVALPTGTESMPIFAIRGLAMEGDPAVRKAAYDAELGAWETNAIPIAAALNAIKGEQQKLARRRGWPTILDAQLFGQAVSRKTLDAMQSAMVDSFPDFRRYLKSKAQLLDDEGTGKGLPFWSLFAPVGATRTVAWDEAQSTVAEAFSSYSPQLQGLARRAFENAWIDAGPRAGKQGGAFCMPMGDGDSRVLLNFNASMPEVFTLAHELGHAYHNTTMTERTPIQRGTPSSLAETASIFCETILIEHGLATTTDAAQRLNLLDVDLQSSTQVIVDIHSRFLFESSVSRPVPTRPSRSAACAI